MLTQYAKIAFRNFRKQKAYVCLSVLGLSIGLACGIFVLLWIQYEVSYDRFQLNRNRLYRVLQRVEQPQGRRRLAHTPAALGRYLKVNLPEIEETARVCRLSSTPLLRTDRCFMENRILAVDPSFLRMFTFPLAVGDESVVLNRPNCMVLTQSAAGRYFGEEAALGKVVHLDGYGEFIVSGVVLDPPDNSHLGFDLLIPISNLAFHGYDLDSWFTEEFYTYLQLRHGSGLRTSTDRINTLLSVSSLTGEDVFELQPIRKIHLDASVEDARTETTARSSILMFFGIALFILATAWFNYVSLVTAYSSERMREIMVRKAIGARRFDVLLQFSGEIVVFAAIAFLIAVVLVEITLPASQRLTAKNLLQFYTNIRMLIPLLAVFGATCVMAGYIPAILLERTCTGTLLHQEPVHQKRNVNVRLAFVFIQLVAAIFLIAGTLVVHKQMRYCRKINLGYDRDQLAVLPLPVESGTVNWQDYETLRNDLLCHPTIENVTLIASTPANISTATHEAVWGRDDRRKNFCVRGYSVAPEFSSTFGIKMLDGCDFSIPPGAPGENDNAAAFLVNEEFVRFLGVTGAVGDELMFMGKKGKIIGVTENFHFGRLENDIEPLVMHINPLAYSKVIVRFVPHKTRSMQYYIKRIWRAVYPDLSFELRFLNQDYNESYTANVRLSRAFGILALFAVFSVAFGFFSLATIQMRCKAKEFGVRKIYGASSADIACTHFSECAGRVLAASLLAWPLVYFTMSRWLMGFVYRIELESSYLFVSGLLVLVIALGSVWSQVIRASAQNPVKSLRWE